jgi:hypothetical protein
VKTTGEREHGRKVCGVVAKASRGQNFSLASSLDMMLF